MKNRTTAAKKTSQRLRRALFDAQRARGAAILRVAAANRTVLKSLLANDAKGALRAKEQEFAAICERNRLSDLVTRLETELNRAGIVPMAPDLRWVAKLMPGALRAAAAALDRRELDRT